MYVFISLFLQILCWNVRPTCQQRINSAENHVIYTHTHARTRTHTHNHTHKYNPWRVFPVYRAIKNQPPPIMSIELDHNPFKCPAADCTKSFRKGSLLHYHIKYYHSDQHFEGQASQQGTPWYIVPSLPVA